MLGLVGLAYAFSIPGYTVANDATLFTRQPPPPPPVPEWCTMQAGWPSFEGAPMEDYSWEEFPMFYDDWVHGYQLGIIPAPIGVLENLVCDMQNTELWKAASSFIAILGPNSARTNYGGVSPTPFQIMETSCKFGDADGVYTQYLYDEFSGTMAWVSSFTFRDIGFGNTWVEHETIYPEWTVIPFADFYEIDIDGVSSMLDSETFVEMSRLNYWAKYFAEELESCFDE